MKGFQILYGIIKSDNMEWYGMEGIEKSRKVQMNMAPFAENETVSPCLASHRPLGGTATDPTLVGLLQVPNM